MTGLSGLPDAAALVTAVRELLEEQVLPDGRPPRSFDVRVAVTALRTVERELAQGPAAAARHRDRLAALGHADDAALAAALRRGQVPGDALPQVRAAVLAQVVDALRIANPGHLEGEDA